MTKPQAKAELYRFLIAAIDRVTEHSPPHTEAGQELKEELVFRLKRVEQNAHLQARETAQESEG